MLKVILKIGKKQSFSSLLEKKEKGITTKISPIFFFMRTTYVKVRKTYKNVHDQSLESDC